MENWKQLLHRYEVSFCGDEHILELEMVVTQYCECTNCHQIFHFTVVNFMLCESHPIKKTTRMLHTDESVNLSRRYKNNKCTTYTPNNTAPKYMKQKLTELKGEIDNSPITVGHFNNPTFNNR